MENEKKNIGGLWLKTSKAGNKFMSGSIEIQGKKYQFAVFKNKHKTEGSNHHKDELVSKPYTNRNSEVVDCIEIVIERISNAIYP